MNDNGSSGARLLGLEPKDLDGHTLDELTDYLDSERTPTNPSIERSPGCRIALDALERLHQFSPELLAADTASEPDVDEGWVAKILAGIALDARAGRRIPLSSAAPRADLAITEGAVRGVIRAAETAVPGTLIGRCQLDGEVAEAGAPVTIQVDVSVPYGEPIPTLTTRLRAEIADRLRAHTELNLAAIDIVVHDIQQFPTPEMERS